MNIKEFKLQLFKKSLKDVIFEGWSEFVEHY